MYKQILKKCGTCDGTGFAFVDLEEITTAGSAKRYELCPTCDGRGMEETGMYIDIIDANDYGLDLHTAEWVETNQVNQDQTSIIDVSGELNALCNEKGRWLRSNQPTWSQG